MAKWGTQHMKGMTSKRPKVSATQARQRRNEAFEELVALRRRDQSEAQVQRLRQEELLRQAAGTQSDEGAVATRNQTASVPRAEDTEASCAEEAPGGGSGEHAAGPRGAVRAKRQRETPADTAEDGVALAAHGREHEDEGDNRPAKQRRTAPPGAGAGAGSHASPSAQEAPPGELPALERAAEEGLARGEPDAAVRVIFSPPNPLPCVPLDPHRLAPFDPRDTAPLTLTPRPPAGAGAPARAGARRRGARRPVARQGTRRPLLAGPADRLRPRAPPAAPQPRLRTKASRRACCVQ
jgi:hypothetical protein